MSKGTRFAILYMLDLTKSPMIVYMELTQACDLACIHCRASAIPYRSKDELTTKDITILVDEITKFTPTPAIVFTGGDPLKREDLFEILQYSINKGIRTCIAPSITPLLTDDILTKFKEIGIARIAFSLDGSNAKIHDSFRGINGSYDKTLSAIRHTAKINLPLQINTTVTKVNYDDIENIGHILEMFSNIVMWSVFFLVPTGRAKLEYDIEGSEYEKIFEIMYRISQTSHFDVKSTEAPHYRRFVIQKNKNTQKPSNTNNTPPIAKVRTDLHIGRLPNANDGKGIVFVSHTGNIFPSGFLQIPCGNVKKESIVFVYRESPTFKLLRDYSKLEGKCGKCEFKNICGGSRSRAYYLTGNLMGSDPKCIYIPNQK